MTLITTEELPTPSEYCDLRSLAGWGELSVSVAKKALEKNRTFNMRATRRRTCWA